MNSYMRKKILIGCIIGVLVSSVCVWSKDVYVSRGGNDGGAGSFDKPYASIGRAVADLEPGDTCFIDDGYYEETLVPYVSGEPQRPISYRKLRPDGKVVLTGLKAIENDRWEQVSPNLFRASVGMSLGEENQVFLGEQMLWEARWPNTGEVLLQPVLAEMDAGSEPTKIVDAELPQYDYKNAKVWVHAPKYWSNWTSKILENPSRGVLEIVNNDPFPGPRGHVASEGSEYYIYGIFDALDSDNEWYYDSQERFIYVYRSDAKMPKERYYYKERLIAVDLSNKSHLEFTGIDVFGATIDTNAETENILWQDSKILFPYFSSEAKTGSYQGDRGVRVFGKQFVLKSSEVAFSSGTGVALFGRDNRILNCYVHDNDFIGTYASCVQLGGKGNIISDSTLTRSGRSVIDYGDMYEALIQHCVLSDAGMLTSDLGLTYGNVIEGGNSEVRYNVLRNNHGEDHNMGLYYDHGTKNIISHHNIVYGVKSIGFLINHPAAYHLVYNNTFISEKVGFQNKWGNQYEPDLIGVRMINNVFGGIAETNAPSYYWSNNIVNYEGFVTEKPFKFDPKLAKRGKFIEGITRVNSNMKPAIGAIESPEDVFEVGHNFEEPRESDLVHSFPMHRNRIKNASFEHEDYLLPWKTKGEVKRIKHKSKIQTTPDNFIGRPGEHSIQLCANGSEVVQLIEGLECNSTFQFTGFLRVESGESACLGVRFNDGREFYSPGVYSGGAFWRQVNLDFDTEDCSTVEVFAKRTSGGNGEVYFDDSGLVMISL